ncbi:Phage tail protein [Promicromonospora umidemergens]|uniref:Siphovirus-type tail component C-terminal domain-containing protein n=1 Tax=Promicromonospora umidemergens TaxID=629679 RepID=A0ABP8XIA5_9MICO|nr:phage tail family protein [Promicromonospora umidemergens]MCP2284883.1 Phage tail protein [Promicromonospora umidemergens]
MSSPAEQILTPPPALTDWQASLKGLILGPGTPYEIAALDGVDELPAIRTEDEARPWAHGDWTAPDWAEARSITATIEIAEEPGLGITYHEALAALRRVMVPTSDEDLAQMWVKLPGRDLMRWAIKIRRHRLPTDQQYELGLAVGEWMAYAPDPVGYGVGLSTSTGFREQAGGLEFPLFSDGGTQLGLENRFTNPSMETDEAWFESGSVSAVNRSTTGVIQPDYSAFIIVDSAPTSTGTGVGQSGGAVVEGDWFAARIPVRPSGASPAPRARVRIQWFAAAGGVISATDTAIQDLPAFSFTRIVHVAQAPAGAASVRAYLFLSGASTTVPDPDTTASTDTWIGAVADTESAALAAVDTYFDGGTPGAQWTGTPNASTSTMFTTAGALDVGHLDFGAPGDAGELTLTNPGTAESWQVYRIDGPTPAEGFDILDVSTGRRLRYTQEIPAGSTVEIDAATADVTLNGVADRSRFLTIREWTPVPAGGSTTVAFLPLGAWAAGMLTAVHAPAWW